MKHFNLPAGMFASAIVLVALTPALFADKKPAAAPAPKAAAPVARPAAPVARPAGAQAPAARAPSSVPGRPAPASIPGRPGGAALPGRPAPTSVPGRPGAQIPGRLAPASMPGRPGAQMPGRPEAGRTPPVGGAPVRDRPLPGGGSAHFVGGRPTEVRRPGFVAHQVPGGRPSFRSERPGGRVVMAYGRGGRGGYVQHPFAYRGQSYVHRTYYVGGRPYVRVYRPYVYRGLTVSIYAPTHYFAPGFYAYAYSPWPRPIVYSAWGWGGAPWFGVYGGFFTPYPVYATPALWLTDYMVAASFQEAYQARLDAQAANNFNQPLTPDIKQQIANEVQSQLQRQQSDAQLAAQNQAPPPPNGLPILDNRPHTLQVYNSMNVASANGGECALTEGDVIQSDGAPPPDGTNASVFVKYAKAQDCQANTLVAVPVDQLQEMSNHMLEVMEQGLNDMQQKQGTGGLPQLSPALTRTTDAPFAAGIPPAEPDVQQALQQTATEGNAALNDAAQAGAGPDPSQGAPGAPAVTDVGLGQTEAQVVSIWGQPQKTSTIGPKRILFYKDSKVTLVNGVVTDVQ